MKMEVKRADRELKISPKLFVQIEERINTQKILLKKQDAITLKKGAKK